MEYVQLCKTLYTLLQDSPEEQDLLQAMGRVANSLLRIGEDNVRATGQTLVGCSTSKPVAIQKSNESNEFTDQKSTAATSTEHSFAEVNQKIVDFQCGPAKTYSKSPTESMLMKTNSYQSSNTFDIAVADAAELEAKWFLSFEQFVAGIQQEPELCQFFAEQNIIDLSGTSVSPVLNQYTRTVLAKT